MRKYQEPEMEILKIELVDTTGDSGLWEGGDPDTDIGGGTGEGSEWPFL